MAGTDQACLTHFLPAHLSFLLSRGLGPLVSLSSCEGIEGCQLGYTAKSSTRIWVPDRILVCFLLVPHPSKTFSRCPLTYFVCLLLKNFKNLKNALVLKLYFPGLLLVELKFYPSFSLNCILSNHDCPPEVCKIGNVLYTPVLSSGQMKVSWMCTGALQTQIAWQISIWNCF